MKVYRGWGFPIIKADHHPSTPVVKWHIQPEAPDKPTDEELKLGCDLFFLVGEEEREYTIMILHGYGTETGVWRSKAATKAKIIPSVLPKSILDQSSIDLDRPLQYEVDNSLKIAAEQFHFIFDKVAGNKKGLRPYFLISAFQCAPESYWLGHNFGELSTLRRKLEAGIIALEWSDWNRRKLSNEQRYSEFTGLPLIRKRQGIETAEAFRKRCDRLGLKVT